MCFPLITSLRIASQELKDHVSKRELYRAKQRTSAYGLSWSEVVLPVLSVPDLKSFNLARLPPTDSWCCIGINRLLSPSESTYDEGRRDYQELRRKTWSITDSIFSFQISASWMLKAAIWKNILININNFSLTWKIISIWWGSLGTNLFYMSFYRQKSQN